MRLLHLYYDLMNLYGEYGNIVVLKKHLEDQGIIVDLDKKTIGEPINFEEYDFIYCGSGTESNQKIALDDILTRKDSILRAISLNKIFLFTGNSCELFGHNIDDSIALQIAPINTVLTKNRYTGDVIVNNSEIGDIVGFINKCSINNYIGNQHLFDYVFKDNNLNDNEFEGFRINNVFGTHIIGPILVKNPNLMKYIVCLIGGLRNDNFVYKDIDYKYEEASYQVTLSALKNRIK